MAAEAAPSAAGAASGAAADPDALHAQFGVDGAVHVEQGVAGMTRVVLLHANGRRVPGQPSGCAGAFVDAHARAATRARSEAGVYLHGANVTTWTISNGSDVLFVRPDTPLDGVKPIRRARSRSAAAR